MASARVSLLFGTALAASLTAFATLTATGCGHVPSPAEESALTTIQACENVSAACPANVAPTMSDMAACASALDGTCAEETNTFQTCVANKCTDAGFDDYGAINLDCGAYQTALENCLEVASGAVDGGSAASGGGVVVVTTPKDAAARD